MFARTRFYILLALHCVNLAIFAYSTSPTLQNTDGSNNVPDSILYVQIVISAFFLFIELRQMIYYHLRYFLSLYNYIDTATFALTLVTAVTMLDSWTGLGPSLEQKSVTMLLLWIRFVRSCALFLRPFLPYCLISDFLKSQMLQTRIYEHIGVFFNVVIDVLFGIVPFLWIIFLVVVAFSHALWILLATLNIPENHFQGYWTSAKYTFLALTQSYSGFDDIDGKSPFADVYRAVFAFITGIILFNVLIALLNNRYNDAFERSQNVYLMQKSQVIAEIEVFFMLPWERRNTVMFPRDLTLDVEEAKMAELKDFASGKTTVTVLCDTVPKVTTEQHAL